MAMILEVGRECIKASGRDACEKVKIIEVMKYPFVTIENSRGKKSRCNAKHLHFPSSVEANKEEGKKAGKVASHNRVGQGNRRSPAVSTADSFAKTARPAPKSKSDKNKDKKKKKGK